MYVCCSFDGSPGKMGEAGAPIWRKTGIEQLPWGSGVEEPQWGSLKGQSLGERPQFFLGLLLPPSCPKIVFFSPFFFVDITVFNDKT